MNRIIVNTAEPGGCVTCGGLRKVRYDAADFGIIGIFPCHTCQSEKDVREFLAPLTDYLGGVVVPEPPQVIA